MQTKITGKFYERRKCYIAGIWIYVTVIIGAISVYFLPGNISGIFNTLNDLVCLLVLFSCLILFLVGYASFLFFRSINVSFAIEDQKLKIIMLKGNNRIRVFDAERFEFIILATTSAKTFGTRLILELRVYYEHKQISFAEDLINNNLGINIKTGDVFYLEHYFCRTPGTLNELYNKLKMENASTSV
ncbi:MAG: hypothetical protein KA140_04525 [Caldisericia bacterium]|nr:hypothetical protein [Caldisericia bacterium]